MHDQKAIYMLASRKRSGPDGLHGTGAWSRIILEGSGEIYQFNKHIGTRTSPADVFKKHNIVIWPVIRPDSQFLATSRLSLPPNFLSGVKHQFQFIPLDIRGNFIAVRRTRKTTLRA